ncbi:hybrid sensor histidine kinase/response regulator transcription factor [Pedobacter gandavensis]|uniref:histidine kinase n=1 Tax=Pedobacter gandavensis TaxID=2679963 RepID=A0ABR6ETQ3_9SPHI|nr:hybrid sensor histidine kinase/response regulator transcription factor [Pedobacter gandavensis]MBB2148199.1 response regulator [Pedobacter gandavensis]
MYNDLKFGLCKIIFILLIFNPFFNVKAQKLSFNSIKVSDGLSQSSVLDIAQDGYGFMWFATRYGLNRYDGTRFKIYKSLPNDTTSLSNSFINTIYCDHQKTLWVGTSTGLNKYDAVNDNFQHIIFFQQKKTIKPNVSCIYENGNELWIGTDNGLYLVSNRQKNSFVSANQLEISPLVSGEVLFTYKDKQGYFWIGTSKELIRCRYNKKISDVKIFRHIPGDNSSISDGPVKSIVEDLQGNLWIGTRTGGLNRFNKKSETFEHYVHQNNNPNSLSHNSIRKMILNKEGNIIIGTQEGISVFNTANYNFHNYKNQIDNPLSLNQNSVYSIFEDKAKNIWVGTYFGGVSISYGVKTTFKTLSSSSNSGSLSSNVVRSIAGDAKGNLWIGTEGGGLNYFNRQTQQVKSFVNNSADPGSLSSNLIKQVYLDTDNHLWIGTSGTGLNLYDPASGKFKRFYSGNSDSETKPATVTTILEDAQKKLWIGGTGVNALYQREGTTLTDITPPVFKKYFKNKSIQKYYEDRNKHIWIVTYQEILLYHPDKKTLSIITSGPKDPEINTFNIVTEDHDGNIWIGLNYGGIQVYNPKTGKFIAKYTTKDGLCNNNILSITEDQQKNLWFGTTNGLSRLKADRKTFQTYTMADGLAGDEFHYNSLYKAPDETIFIGGLNGITYFSPLEIQQNNDHSPLSFIGIRLFNDEAEKTNGKNGILPQNIILRPKLTFNSNQNIFTIEFALLNYIKPGKNKYAYKLQGVNKNWNQSYIPEATYTNLPAGEYVFSVKGANNDGIWSEPINIAIKILPPLWKTWWAYTLYMMILGTITFFFVRFFFLRQLIKRDEELHQLKLNFFTNVSHEIRSHLTLIMVPLEKVIDETKNNDIVSKQLTYIKKNTDRLVRLVTELMDFRRAETNNLKLNFSNYDIIRFLDEIYSSFKEVCAIKNISLSFFHAENELFVAIEKGQMEKVIFNLLSNAVKFTPENGSIILTIDKEVDSVIISVANTGAEIPAEYYDKLFTNYYQIDGQHKNNGYGIGLALSKRIIDLHNGTIAVKSETGNTVFTIKIPIHNTQTISSEPQLVENKSDDIQVYETSLQSSSLAQDIGKFTILIVEDNEKLRALIRSILEKEYKILESVDGLAGLEMATNEIPDLIISDIMMPNKNGLELCQNIKTDERTSHIPVILLTAKTSQTDQISGLAMRADLYLTKPFSKNVLLLNVRNILESRALISAKYRQQFLFEPKNILIDNLEEQFLSKLIGIIEDSMENREFGVDILSDKMGISQSVLYKKIKALTNMTVNDFSKSIRLKKAAQMLSQKKYSISEISYMVGFIDTKYFTKEFKKQFGTPPSQYNNSSTFE